VNGEALGRLITLVVDGKVGRDNAKKILAEMFENDLDPEAYAKENGFIVSNDTGLIEKVIAEAIAADPRAVADFKGGKEKALMALFGKCMKQLKGNCDPQVLRAMLIDEINKA
jgi:aspartyl-tRNA(Asn)/glutamyl-tRNA(Gln) amidotransferase subunit B